MDSRIEELAQIIRERAREAAHNVQAAADGIRGDRFYSWNRLFQLSAEMQTVIDDYRKSHPEEYEDMSIARALQREKELQEQVVSLRNELRTYREREKTMGWSQD
jgi:hypothetical protein